MVMGRKKSDKHSVGHYENDIKKMTRNTAYRYAISTECADIMDAKGRLAGDWIELAGPGALTCEMLLGHGALGGNTKFVGVDADIGVIEGCRSKYAHLPDVTEWRHATFKDYLIARNEEEKECLKSGIPPRRTSVIVFDGFSDVNCQTSLDDMGRIAKYICQYYNVRKEYKLGTPPVLVITVFSSTHYHAGGKSREDVLQSIRSNWEEEFLPYVEYLHYQFLPDNPFISSMFRRKILGVAFMDDAAIPMKSGDKSFTPDPDKISSFVYKSNSRDMVWTAALIRSKG
jgi:hypothetical protein